MSQISQLKSLQSASSLNDLANLVGFRPAALAYLIYHKPDNTRYLSFEIPKRSGGTRKISAPSSDLKKLQKNISFLLQNCVDEINQNKNITSFLSHGFRRGCSIISNAEQHRNRRYVFNVDLKDFFPSIHFGRVKGFFEQNKNFKLQPKIATMLAQIICHERSLPQGSPCSPVVSNLIGHILDIRLVELARKEGCTYSRYADDLTFSTNKKVFPESIAVFVQGSDHQWQVGQSLLNIISHSTFSINEEKVRMQYCDSRQTVTGLIVNSKVHTVKEYRRLARAKAHSLFSTGLFHNGTPDSTAVNTTNNGVNEGTINQLAGVLSYIYMVDDLKRNSTRNELTSIEKTHKDFLFYKNFYSTPMPTILCEGKTDNIYLRCAILAHAQNYPQLAKIKPDGSISANVNIFKYSKQTDYLLKLSGGTGDLANFISTYLHTCGKFKSTITKSPVIIIVDNDIGSKGIYSSVKKASNQKEDVNGSKKFYYIGQNLYVVPTPFKENGDQTTMEDLFKPELLNKTYNGKSLHLENSALNSQQYSKHKFAEFVVKPDWKNIDFSGFSDILETINEIVDRAKV